MGCAFGLLSLIAGLVTCAVALGAETGATRTTPLIEITMKTSREHPTAGTGLGVMADVRNVSTGTIYLRQKNFSLVLPPELEGPTAWSYGRYGAFPSEQPLNQNDEWDVPLRLKPGDTYRVFWTTTYGDSASTGWVASMLGKNSLALNVYRQVRSELAFLFFTPGTYAITVDAKYWTDSTYTDHGYHTVMQSTTLDVAAPQFVILVGAAIGGTIAYFILPRGRRRLVGGRHAHATRAWRVAVELAGLFGSMLLSSIVTILLARLSETQFLVKITVADVWGGVAIGFIANYLGGKALERLIPDRGPEPAPASSIGLPRASIPYRRSDEGEATGPAHV